MSYIDQFYKKVSIFKTIAMEITDREIFSTLIIVWHKLFLYFSKLLTLMKKYKHIDSYDEMYKKKRM